LGNLRLHGFEGHLHPISPKYAEIGGLACVRSLAELDHRVDLALVAVPAVGVADVLSACGAAGVRAVIVFSAGFSEIGPDGFHLDQQLRTVARESAIRVCGPNSLGVVSAATGLAASFASFLADRRLDPRGRAALVSQSGAFGAYIASEAIGAGTGLRDFISVGNESDLTTADFLLALARDDDIMTIGAYVEGIRDPHRFVEAIEAVKAAGKSLGIIKVGRTPVGRVAVSSHTGSIAGETAEYDALFDKYGVVRVRDPEHMMSFLAHPRTEDAPPILRRAAVITVSGGVGAWFADELTEQGFELQALDPASAAALQHLLPDFAAISNPIDTTASILTQPDMMRRTVEVVCADPNVDTVVVALGLQAEVGEVLAACILDASHHGKAVVVAWMGAPAGPLTRLQQAGLPVFGEFYRCVQWLGQQLAVDANAATAAPSRGGAAGGRGPVAPDGPGVVRGSVEAETKRVLESWGFVIPRGRLVADAFQLAAAVEETGLPVIMKGQAASIPHKSSAGVVVAGIGSLPEAELAFETIRARLDQLVPGEEGTGVLVEAMIDPGVDVLLAVRRTQFGNLIVIGAGGTDVEAIGDTAVALGPLRDDERERLINRTAIGRRLSSGGEGHLATALGIAIDRLQDVMDGSPSVTEIELNPIRLQRESPSAVVLDALVT